MEDIYARITNSIIEALERGVAPWVRPWSAAADPLPINATTRRPYRGVNFLSLQLECALRGYTRNIWLTYRQASELGAQVRKGERGVPIVFWRLRKVDARGEALPSQDEQDVNARVVPLLRQYHIWNVQQITNLPSHLLPAPASVDWEPEAAAEEILIRSQADIRYGGESAYYHPGQDYIQLPERGAFSDSASFYSSAVHELAHWTGHPKRLNRNLSGRFGDESYAVEELIAELATAYVCASLRLNGRLQHDSYISSWLRVLKSDKRAIFVVASRATQASDFLVPYRDPLTAVEEEQAA